MADDDHRTAEDQRSDARAPHEVPTRRGGDLATVVAVAAGAIALAGVFAAGLFAGYTKLAGINRELGAIAARDDEVERRLARLKEGQAAIRADVAQVLHRLEAIERAVRPSDRRRLAPDSRR